MKKAITLFATALLFIVGAMNLNAKNKVQEDVYYYGFLTSCGEEFLFALPFELPDDICVEISDQLEDLFCN